MGSSDAVAIGDLKLNDFTFAEVDNTAGFGLGYRFGKFDGILGLGWDAISVGRVPTVMKALVESKQMAQPVFAFYLGNKQPGELVFGGVDSKHYTGDFTFVPLSQKLTGRSCWMASKLAGSQCLRRRKLL